MDTVWTHVVFSQLFRSEVIVFYRFFSQNIFFLDIFLLRRAQFKRIAERRKHLVSGKHTVVTKLKRNMLRLLSFFELEMPPRRRRQSFCFILVTTVVKQITSYICPHHVLCEFRVFAHSAYRFIRRQVRAYHTYLYYGGNQIKAE